jgi:hypothetical protein
VLRLIEHGARIIQAPGVKRAPRHQRGRPRRRARELVPQPAGLQPIRDLDRARVLLGRDEEHQLRGGQARRRERTGVGEKLQPAPREGEIEAVEDRDDGALGRGHRGGGLPAGEQLLDRLLVAALAHQQPPVRDPLRRDRLLTAALEALAQELAKARVDAHRRRMVLPGQRQMAAAQRREPLGGIAMAEPARALGRDLVEQRRLDEEVAVGRLEAGQDAGRQVPVQRVGLAVDDRQVGRRAPRLEDDAGHPSARRGDGRVGRFRRHPRTRAPARPRRR